MKTPGKNSKLPFDGTPDPNVQPQLPPDCPPARPEPQPEHERNQPLKHSPEVNPQPNHPLSPPSKQSDPGGEEHAFRDVIPMYPSTEPRNVKHRLMNLRTGYKISDLLKSYGFVA
jgi:hypothetical protein